MASGQQGAGGGLDVGLPHQAFADQNGAGSGFSYRPLPGPFIARSSVRTNVTDSSLIEFFKELRNRLVVGMMYRVFLLSF